MEDKLMEWFDKIDDDKRSTSIIAALYYIMDFERSDIKDGSELIQAVRAMKAENRRLKVKEVPM